MRRPLAIALVAAGLGLAVAPPALARPRAPRVAKPPVNPRFNACLRYAPDTRIKVTLKENATLQEMTRWISAVTCKPMIVDALLPTPTVTFRTPGLVSVRAAMLAYQAALNMLGMTVVDMGPFYKVIQVDVAIHRQVPTYVGTDYRRVPKNGKVVTVVRPVRSVDANALVPVLDKMRTRRGSVDVYRARNLIIFADVAHIVRRMMKVADALDQASPAQRIWTIALRHHASDKVKPILDQLFVKPNQFVPQPAPADAEAPRAVDAASISATKVIASDDGRHLFVLATPASFAAIRALLDKVDVPPPKGREARLFVYRLRHRSAEEVAKTLAAVVGGAGAPRRGQQAAVAGGKGPFKGEVKITPSKETNSIVFSGALDDFLEVRQVLRKLDIPRRQVFIDAVIVEVTLDGNLELGVAGHGGLIAGEGQSESLLFAGSQSPEVSSILLNPLALMGLAAGARGAQLTGSGRLLGFPVDIPRFGVALQALKRANNVDVISSPHILTTDNNEAEIVVGQNIPFQGALLGGGLGASLGLPAGINASVQRQDVALKMKITPQVGESGTVRLKIDQSIQDIASRNFNGLGPSTSKRTAKLQVVVKDGQTVVIGGLTSHRENRSTTKIPWLGDIPLLGNFFRYRKTQRVKTTLLMLVTPHVIYDASDLRRVLEKKLADRQEFIEAYTHFKVGEVGAEIDYRYKTGLLGRIHRLDLEAAKEAALKEKRRREIEAIERRERPEPVTVRPAGARGRPAPGR